MLVDTHTHIHDVEFFEQNDAKIREVLENSARANVKKLVLIGTSLEDSENAVEFAKKWKNFAKNIEMEFAIALGIHPHMAEPGKSYSYTEDANYLEDILTENSENDNVKIVAIGEIGLDYFYDFEFRERQIDLLKVQLKLAKKWNLPVNFHIRDFKKPDMENSVWKDFWKIFDDENFAKFGHEIPIIFHSYTEQSRENLAKILRLPNAFFGVNGISTFAKDSEQDLWKTAIPLEKMVLETDAPFLAPKGFRGQENEPARVKEIAENLAELRAIQLKEVAKITTENAREIYKI
jgi:TatD DNase family protein